MTAAKLMDIFSLTTRMRRTSSRRSISLHPGQNGRCTIIVDKSEVRMPRHLDSSTTTQLAKIMVQYGRPSRSSWAESVRSLFRTIFVGKARQFEKVLLEHGWEYLFVNWQQKLFLSVYADDMKLTGKKQNIDPMWKILMKDVALGEPTSLHDHVYLGCTQKRMLNKQGYCGQLQEHVWIQNLCWSFRKATKYRTLDTNHFVMVLWHGRSCKETRGKILRTGNQNNPTVIQSRNAMHWRPPIQGRRNGICWRIVKSLLTDCSEMIVFGPYCRLDILCSVNKLARAITKSTRACDKRVARLISHIHHACEFKQFRHVGNTAQTCRLGLFQDSDFAGDLEDSKSTSSGFLCIFGSHTFVPISWMCKKQTSVSHSSTEAEIISLDARYAWMELQLLIFGIWSWKCSTLHQTNSTTPKIKCRETCRVTPHQRSTPTLKRRFQTQHDNFDLNNDDCVPSNATFSRFGAMLHQNEGEKDARTGRKQQDRGNVEADDDEPGRLCLDTSSSTVNSPIASKSPGILKAPCRTDWSSTGKPDARDRNHDAASSSRGRQKDAFLDVSTGKLVATEEDQERLNFPEDLASTGKRFAPGYQGYPGTPGETRKPKAISIFRQIMCNTWRNSSRSWDKDMVAVRRVKWKTSIWTQRYGVYLCLSFFQAALHLGKD